MDNGKAAGDERRGEEAEGVSVALGASVVFGGGSRSS